MFPPYVAPWLPDILVNSSTGTRHSVTGLSDVTPTSAVRWVITRELPLDFIKATRYTTESTYNNRQNKNENIKFIHLWMPETYLTYNLQKWNIITRWLQKYIICNYFIYITHLHFLSPVIYLEKIMSHQHFNCSIHK